jgi:hypothetical protein
VGVAIHVTDAAVTVELDGLERVLAVAGHLEVPVESIVSARVAPVDSVRDGLGWRSPGAYLPGYLAVGWFAVPERPGARQFWCVQRDRDALVIDTDLERPARLVLQHPDAARLAWWISERIDPGRT